MFSMLVQKKSDEDCGSDGDVKECSVKINLKSKLVCYTHKSYRNVNTIKNKLKPGDIGYCDMRF